MARRAGFTVVEVLIAGVIGILVSTAAFKLISAAMNSGVNARTKGAAEAELKAIINLVKKDLDERSLNPLFVPTPLLSTAFPVVTATCVASEAAQCNGLAIWKEYPPIPPQAPMLIEYNTQCVAAGPSELINFAAEAPVHLDANRANGGITCTPSLQKPTFSRRVWKNYVGGPPAPNVPGVVSDEQRDFPNLNAVGAAVCFKLMNASGGCSTNPPFDDIVVEASEIFRTSIGGWDVARATTVIPISADRSNGITIIK